MKSGNFYNAAILPELLGRWFTRSNVMPTIDDRGNSSYNYCYYKEELGGVMIHCDSDEKCPYGEWFYLECLKLKNAPRKKRSSVALNATRNYNRRNKLCSPIHVIKIIELCM